ncbi:hypothetical protein lerEdw1_014525 [Lerista edwardsae]|nr:hypothetical protein lerEdw1_014525 [Lerista edwardsae]
MAALRAEEPVAWWEALKWEVGRRCRALAAIAYRREVQDYHRALARFLSAVQDINRFHQRKRRQRLQAQRYRAKGPVVAPEEWARTRAAGGPKGREQPRPFVGLRLAEGDPVEDSVQGMLGVMGRFYGDLFTPRRVPASGEVEAFLQRAPFPAPGAVGQGGLTEQQRAALVAPVSPEEVRAAIKAGRSASAPGADGLPYFFFQCFADLLAKPLVAAFNAALQGRARFSDSFFAGLLRFFFKGGDPTLAQNWHPIAVTNVDYRLLARVLNARLAAVASRLVAEGQTNAVPGRRMGNSLALMRELFLAAAGGRWQRLLVQLDQSKAFDRVDRAYLWAVLHARGVPEGYIRLLQRLYERATAVPTVEGWRGEPVPLASGLRQGCPLSPLLYVLALDPLLETVRADGRIAGVLARGSGRRLKAVAHADDAYVLLTEYGAVSGAAVNTTKSQCYALGPGPPDIAWRPLEVVPGAAAVWAVKVLGVHFGLERAAWETDWRAWAEAVRERIVGLSTWRLDIYQRVRFFSVYCVPAALGLFSGSCGAAGASRWGGGGKSKAKRLMEERGAASQLDMAESAGRELVLCSKGGHDVPLVQYEDSASEGESASERVGGSPMECTGREGRVGSVTLSAGPVPVELVPLRLTQTAGEREVRLTGHSGESVSDATMAHLLNDEALSCPSNKGVSEVASTPVPDVRPVGQAASSQAQEERALYLKEGVLKPGQSGWGTPVQVEQGLKMNQGTLPRQEVVTLSDPQAGKRTEKELVLSEVPGASQLSGERSEQGTSVGPQGNVRESEEESESDQVTQDVDALVEMIVEGPWTLPDLVRTWMFFVFRLDIQELEIKKDLSKLIQRDVYKLFSAAHGLMVATLWQDSESTMRKLARTKYLVTLAAEKIIHFRPFKKPRVPVPEWLTEHGLARTFRGLARHWRDYCAGLNSQELVKGENLPLCQLARTLVTTGVQLAGVLERVADALDARRRLMTGSGYNPFLNVSEAVSSENDEDEGDVELEMDVEPSRWTAGKQRSEESASREASGAAPRTLPSGSGGVQARAMAYEPAMSEQRQQGASSRAMPPSSGEHDMDDCSLQGRVGRGQSDGSGRVSETPSGERPQNLELRGHRVGSVKEQAVKRDQRSHEQRAGGGVGEIICMERQANTPVLHCQKTGLNSNISGEMRTDLVRLNSGECNLEGDKRSGRLALQVTLGMQRRDITGYGRKLKDIVVQRVAAGQNVPGVTGWN